MAAAGLLIGVLLLLVALWGPGVASAKEAGTKAGGRRGAAAASGTPRAAAVQTLPVPTAAADERQAEQAVVRTLQGLSASGAPPLVVVKLPPPSDDNLPRPTPGGRTVATVPPLVLLSERDLRRNGLLLPAAPEGSDGGGRDARFPPPGGGIPLGLPDPVPLWFLADPQGARMWVSELPGEPWQSPTSAAILAAGDAFGVDRDVFQNPIGVYPRQRRGKDGSPDQNFWERIFAYHAEEVWHRNRSPFRPVSVLYALGAQLPNTFNRWASGRGWTYAYQQIPASIIRETILRNGLEEPILEDPNFNAGLDVAICLGAAWGTEAVMRRLSLSSGMWGTIFVMNGSAVVLGRLKEVLAQDTLDTPWSGQVANPLKILPQPNRYGENYEPIFDNWWDYDLDLLAGALAVAIPAGAGWAYSYQGGPPLLRVAAGVATGVVVAINYAITRGYANPPPKDEPVLRPVLQLLHLSGIPGAWHAINRVRHEPDPDSFGENLASFAVNSTLHDLTLLKDAWDWGWSWTAQRNKLLDEALEARLRGDHETEQRLLGDPRAGWFDPEAAARRAQIGDQAWRAWKRSLDATATTRLERIAQSSMLLADMALGGSFWQNLRKLGENAGLVQPAGRASPPPTPPGPADQLAPDGLPEEPVQPPPSVPPGPEPQWPEPQSQPVARVSLGLEITLDNGTNVRVGDPKAFEDPHAGPEVPEGEPAGARGEPAAPQAAGVPATSEVGERPPTSPPPEAAGTLHLSQVDEDRSEDRSAPADDGPGPSVLDNSALGDDGLGADLNFDPDVSSVAG
ncbi:MAG TPA: hypothetical protein VKG45_01125 [Actinomycetes bacterium]|nr:hypothetical protein [Actinomycetes bacterium]